MVDVAAGFALVVFSLVRGGIMPSLAEVALAVLTLACALAILYALWIMVVSLAFHVVKIDNLSYLIVSTFDAARWPSSVFRGALAFIFTFVVPLTLMTTYPALALLGRMTHLQTATTLGVAAAFLVCSRLVWLRSIRSYTGAGG